MSDCNISYMRLLATINEYLKIRNYVNYKITDDVYEYFADRTAYWIYYDQKHNIITIIKPNGLYHYYSPNDLNDNNSQIDLNLSDPQLLNKIENVLLGKL